VLLGFTYQTFTHWKFQEIYIIWVKMSFFKDASPKKAGSDLLAVLREKRGDRFPLLIAACLPPAMIMLMVNGDVNRHSERPAAEVIYFESWPATRTREESLASNIERQKAIDERTAQQREAYKALGRAAGLDVERMEREALAAAAERKAKQAKAIEESLKKNAGASQ
jgi:hypothetical protein